MASKPTVVDDIFFISILLLFLMINYDMPLASIYTSMTYIVLFMYLTPIIFHLFEWIPVTRDLKKSLVWGVGLGIAFILFYNSLQTVTPMASVFATTAFGESEEIGKGIFGGLIPIIETVFFFIILPYWVIWKLGWSFNLNIFSAKVIGLITALSGVFVLFHSTAKGIDNNLDLLATFVFAVLSIGAVLYFKEALIAIIIHVVVNSHAIKLFSDIWGWVQSGALMSSSALIIGGAVLIGYLVITKKIKVPFMS